MYVMYKYALRITKQPKTNKKKSFKYIKTAKSAKLKFKFLM